MTCVSLSSEFATFMIPLVLGGKRPHTAVAVSGGADSMALALLTHAWAANHGGNITALTVDHRLRPESSQEAAQVAGWMKERGIAHHILPWEGEKPVSNIQAEAREARYRLLTEWCRQHNVQHLLLAHHLDDQAETVLMRLARGSGVDGLAAMPEVSEHNGITLLRPLLSLPKEKLVAFLREQQQPWLEDPSNKNDAFDRVRLREALASLADYPLLRQRLADTAAHMARARQVLDNEAGKAMALLVQQDTEGNLVLDLLGWRELKEDTALRVLAQLVREINGQHYHPRFDSLMLLYSEMKSLDFSTTRSFGGCLWAPSRKKGQGHLVTIAPEPK